MSEHFRYLCPECGSDNLTVDAVATLDLVQDKEGNVQALDNTDHGYPSWDSDSPMVCGACGHSAPALDFDIEERRKPATLPVTKPEPVEAVTTNTNGSLSIALAALDRGNISDAERRAIAICDAADAMYAALSVIMKRSAGKLYDTDQVTGDTFDSIALAALAMADGGEPIPIDDDAEKLALAIERYTAASVDEWDVLEEAEKDELVSAAEGMASALASYREDRPVMPTLPPKLYVFIEGGNVQSHFSRTPIEVIVIDHDTDGCDENDLYDFGTDKRHEYATIRRGLCDIAPDACDDIEAMWREGTVNEQKDATP